MARKKKPRRISATYVDHPSVRKGLEYAEAVAAGDIPTGQYTRLACIRQLDDLKRSAEDESWPYYFDPDEADRVIQIIERLPHTKGKWAGKPIKLEPWQKFIFSTLFGWLQRADDFRRYREAYLGISRKNGKSLLGAATGLVMLAFDGENGAEVYCGATTEKQANEVFRPALRMVKMTDGLREMGIQPFASSIAVEDDGSLFQKIIGNPGDGQSPSCAITDEYHEHDTTDQYDTMQSGMLARDQPLHLVITTAGSSYGGPCYLHEQDCKRVLDKVIPNERLFVCIYHADADDDWSSPEVLEKANPNLGVSIMRDTLLAMQEQAKSSPQHQNRFRTKHLNQWVSAKTAWLNMLKWHNCQVDGLSLDAFEGRKCLMALDLASKSDLAVAMRLFWERREDGRLEYAMFPRFYLPEDAVMEDGSGNYSRWQHMGLLTVTDGNEIDFRRIREDVEADMARFDVQEVVYDPWRATQLAQELTEDGATCVEYRNTVANMSEPMKELEAAVNGGRLKHDGNEVMTFCASNVVAKEDAKSNIYPRKERPENKIDGVVAGIMAVGRVLYREEPGDLDDFIRNMVTA